MTSILARLFTAWLRLRKPIRFDHLGCGKWWL